MMMAALVVLGTALVPVEVAGEELAGGRTVVGAEVVAGAVDVEGAARVVAADVDAGTVVATVDDESEPSSLHAASVSARTARGADHRITWAERTAAPYPSARPGVPGVPWVADRAPAGVARRPLASNSER